MKRPVEGVAAERSPGPAAPRAPEPERSRGPVPEPLERNLEALSRLLERPGFGRGTPTIGAELELFIIDDAGLPLRRNVEICAELGDHRVKVELLRHTIEFNLTPVCLEGRPFSALAREARELCERVRRAVREVGGRVVAIGIPPTFRLQDLQPAALTDTPRLRLLSQGLHNLRGDPFEVEILGVESTRLTCDHMFLAGSSASFQAHLRVDPAAFVQAFNAAQLATVPVLAASGNSPTFLGSILWEETRITVLEQALNPFRASTAAPGRIGFATGWARGGPADLFEESLRRHPAVLPLAGDEDPMTEVERGRVPALTELRTHSGTIWPWNRAIFDAAGDGHLRIEMRALPAGPTFIDEAANAAFLIGLTLALAPAARRWPDRLPFDPVRRSFYLAARHGLGAAIAWPSADGAQFDDVPVTELVPRLLPLAAGGLRRAGVDHEEVDGLLGLIAERVRARATGADWQRRALDTLSRRLGRERALAATLDRYAELAESGLPVHRWPAAS